MWVKGQPWRTVNSLLLLHRQLKEAAGRARPPATDVNSWGTIADDAHSSGSDHYPHFYTVLGSTAVVCAADWPHVPRLGLDCAVVCEALRQSRDARIKYVIFNRRMFSSYPTSSYPAWTWRPYPHAATDPHDDHAHASVRSTVAADSTTPWQIGIGGGDMALEPTDRDFQALCETVACLRDGAPKHRVGPIVGAPVWLVDRLGQLEQAIAALAARPPVEVSAAELAEALLQNEAFGKLIEDRSFAGHQRGERE